MRTSEDYLECERGDIFSRLLGEQVIEHPELFPGILMPFNRPKPPLGDRRSTVHVGHGEDMLLDLRREP